MDQATFNGLFSTFQGQVSDIHDISATPGDPAKPIVVLVHGIGGNARHWSDPVGLSINDTWLFDTDKPPQSKGALDGLVPSAGYQAGTVRTWTQALATHHISAINFSQSNENGPIATAVGELVKVLTTVESAIYGPLTASGGTVPPLVIIAHSRGGLVTRHALKQIGSAGLPHLQKVITLSTPHTGSYMPKLANDYNSAIATQINFNSLGGNLPGPIHTLMQGTIDKYLSQVGNWLRTALGHSFGSMAQGDGFNELIPGSAMFQALTANEQPLPNVRYYGFGGSKPTFVILYLGAAGQHFPLLATASTQLIELFDRFIPALRSDLGGLPELTTGDSSVGQESSKWPAAFNTPHQFFPYNHMQALIHQPLQDAVLNIVEQS